MENVNGTVLNTDRKRQAFIAARTLARELGKIQRFVTSDMVQVELEKSGYTSADLGNAAGMVFRSKEWVRTDQAVQTTRKIGHGRVINIWRFVG
jgi:hypothetical protein